MAESDLEQVVSIERECLLSSYGEERYLKLLSDRSSLMLVAVEPDLENRKRQIVGLFSAFIVVDEVQIDNVAVTMRLRRRGIASRLLEEGLTIACQRGARDAVLEVRSANLPARLLYELHGFTVSGIRRDYYHDPTDDALIMTRKLDLTQRR
ncbi:MAG: GNAT family N-acetyltransferase [Blastocatellia bacterium]|nr:GNAT family N-acetyltransferase [Blastocatellia bacterium]